MMSCIGDNRVYLTKKGKQLLNSSQVQTQNENKKTRENVAQGEGVKILPVI